MASRMLYFSPNIAFRETRLSGLSSITSIENLFVLRFLGDGDGFVLFFEIPANSGEGNSGFGGPIIDLLENKSKIMGYSCFLSKLPF